MGRWSIVILMQLIFVGNIFCQTETWTLTNWQEAGKPPRRTDYQANQYSKVRLNHADSTFSWRDVNGGHVETYIGTFVRKKDGKYLMTDSHGVTINAEIDTEHKVTCEVLTGLKRITYWGEVDK